MKKMFCTTLIMILCSVLSAKAEFLTFSQAQSQSKPCAIMVYASWADNLENIDQAFNNISQIYNNDYNFVKLDIANKDAKAFNKNNVIYQNLPYIILYRNNGKITRFVEQACISDKSCMIQRFNSFIQK